MANKFEFTTEQENVIVEAYVAGEGVRDIAARFPSPTTGKPIAFRSIRRVLVAHNVAIRRAADTVVMKCRLSPEQSKTAAELYGDGFGTESIAKRLGVSDHRVKNALREAGVTIRDLKAAHRLLRRYECDEEAFAPPAVGEKAYHLGWCGGDGCVIENPAGEPYTVSISLQEGDRAYLEELLRFLRCDAPVRTYQRKERTKNGCVIVYSKIDVHSKSLATSLAYYGIVPRKSMVFVPKNIEDARSFLRGYVCANGNVRIHEQKNYPELSVVGSLAVCHMFADYVETIVGEKPSVREDDNIWRTAVCAGKAVAVIRDLFREGELALARKAEAAREILARFGDRPIRRPNHLPRVFIEAFGRSLCAADWESVYGVARDTILVRLKRYRWNAEDAVSVPAGQPRPKRGPEAGGGPNADAT